MELRLVVEAHGARDFVRQVRLGREGGGQAEPDRDVGLAPDLVEVVGSGGVRVVRLSAQVAVEASSSTKEAMRSRPASFASP
jgi:hypothetical protein